jgi:hypothetical protein
VSRCHKSTVNGRYGDFVVENDRLRGRAASVRDLGKSSVFDAP